MLHNLNLEELNRNNHTFFNSDHNYIINSDQNHYNKQTFNSNQRSDFNHMNNISSIHFDESTLQDDFRHKNSEHAEFRNLEINGINDQYQESSEYGDLNESDLQDHLYYEGENKHHEFDNSHFTNGLKNSHDDNDTYGNKLVN